MFVNLHWNERAKISQHYVGDIHRWTASSSSSTPMYVRTTIERCVLPPFFTLFSMLLNKEKARERNGERGFEQRERQMEVPLATSSDRQSDVWQPAPSMEQKWESEKENCRKKSCSIFFVSANVKVWKLIGQKKARVSTLLLTAKSNFLSRKPKSNNEPRF